MKKHILLFISFSFCTLYQLQAQQDAMYTQYMFNTLAINPAYAGARDVLSITALNRSQWVGMEGAPETRVLSMHSPLGSNKMGLGLQLFSDQLGITKTTGAFLSYAYRIRTGEKSTLSFGLQGGVANFKADYTQVPLGSGPADESFSQPVNKLLPNLGAGLYFSTEKFYLGFSAPHLLKNTLNESSGNNSGKMEARQYIQYFTTAGFSLDLSENFCLKPSALLKVVQGAPLQLDINSVLWIRDFIAFGVSYRTAADLAALAQVQISRQLRLGYAYDYGINGLNNFNSGSHEIMVRYEFNRNKENYMGPRNF